jgi:hypothetical protein
MPRRCCKPERKINTQTTQVPNRKNQNEPEFSQAPRTEYVRPIADAKKKWQTDFVGLRSSFIGSIGPTIDENLAEKQLHHRNRDGSKRQNFKCPPVRSRSLKRELMVDDCRAYRDEHESNPAQDPKKRLGMGRGLLEFFSPNAPGKSCKSNPRRNPEHSSDRIDPVPMFVRNKKEAGVDQNCQTGDQYPVDYGVKFDFRNPPKRFS